MAKIAVSWKITWKTRRHHTARMHARNYGKRYEYVFIIKRTSVACEGWTWSWSNFKVAEKLQCLLILDQWAEPTGQRNRHLDFRGKEDASTEERKRKGRNKLSFPWKGLKYVLVSRRRKYTLCICRFRPLRERTALFCILCSLYAEFTVAIDIHGDSPILFFSEIFITRCT